MASGPPRIAIPKYTVKAHPTVVGSFYTCYEIACEHEGWVWGKTMRYSSLKKLHNKLKRMAMIRVKFPPGEWVKTCAPLPNDPVAAHVAEFITVVGVQVA